MSTPNPLEDQAQLEGMPRWNPWNGSPQPHWYSGLGFGDDTAHLGPLYQIGTALGSGAEKGAAVLTGLWGSENSFLAQVGQALHIPGSKALQESAEFESGVSQTASDNAQKLTPDAATTGAAAQTLHSLVSGGARFAFGALTGGPIGGAATVGGTEALSRYRELRDQGVDEGTARSSAAVAALTSGVGAFVPGGYGSALFARLATGAAMNAGFGAANRYLDHQVLENGGYHEMAEQQRTLDGMQLLVDGVLGAGFGGLAHLHAQAEAARVNATPTWTPTPREVPGAEDAALAANLALRDRAAAPGVPVDPAAANAHHAAMQKATADLLAGEPVDVSGTGVDRADFARRPTLDTTEPENLLVNVLKESGILDEERNLQQLEAALERRLAGQREPVQTPAEPESVTLETPEEQGYTVGEEELTDDQRTALERRAHPQDQELQATLGGGGEAGEGRTQDDGRGGGVGAAGQPTRVYRGGRGGPLTAEHFSPEALGRATGHPSSGLGVFFTGDVGDAARYGTVTEHDLALRNPKHIPVEELPGFDTLQEAHDFREQLRAEGHDGIILDSSHLGGPKHYIAFEHGSVKPAAPDSATQPLAERPGLQIPDESGNLQSASNALQQADAAATQGEQEAPKATEAAVNCFLRKGGA